MSLHGSTVSLHGSMPSLWASTAVLRICITLIADPAFYFDVDPDLASQNGVDPCGSRSSTNLGDPHQPFPSTTASNSKCNDDIHLCLLVFISPWWIGGARSEATHSPQLLMHKEKAGEGWEMYFLLGFHWIPPFDIVTTRVEVLKIPIPWIQYIMD